MRVHVRYHDATQQFHEAKVPRNFFKALFRAGKLARKGSLFQASTVLQKALGGLPSLKSSSKKPRPRKAVRTARKPVIRQARPAAKPLQRTSRARPGPQRQPILKPDYAAGLGLLQTGYFDRDGHQGRYKLFVPRDLGNRLVPLVVMLHGCSQSPDDFALGTGMNERAAAQGFIVLYPAQARTAHPSGCWNWFRRQHQGRDKGEPAMIAGMTRMVIDDFNVDPGRVYIAGLSAGGAMAAILATVYPELYSAVGVHSGLPAGAATSLAGALAVMRSGIRSPRAAPVSGHPAARPVPTIVFHGDADRIVHPDNGQAAVHASLFSSGHAAVRPTIAHSAIRGGRKFSRSRYAAADGKTVAEHWIVTDGPHAWSGGSSRGSYTDPGGPSATDEMLRFFLQTARQP